MIQFTYLYLSVIIKQQDCYYVYTFIHLAQFIKQIRIILQTSGTVQHYIKISLHGLKYIEILDLFYLYALALVYL